MAGRCRTIDPALFQKAEFRRATYVQREVWLGVIATCCDDEGRFEADPWNLAELIFSRAHDATEEDVRGAIVYWESAGWICLYEGGKYGFLTGWYEHQSIRDPNPSSYPPPPVAINSWRVVTGIKEWHKANRGGKENTRFITIVREFEQSLRSEPELSAYLVRTDCVPGKQQKGREGKGLEGIGEENPLPPAGAGGLEETDLDPFDETIPPKGTIQRAEHEYAGMVLCNSQELHSAFDHLQPSWGVRKCQQWTLDTVASIDDPEEEIVTWESVRMWVNTKGYRPHHSDGPARNWIRRCIAKTFEKSRKASGGSRAGPQKGVNPMAPPPASVFDLP